MSNGDPARVGREEGPVISGPSRFAIATRFLRLLPSLVRSGPTGRFTAGDLLEQAVRRRGDAPFVRFEERVCTYRDINALANRVAHWAIGRGIGPGSVVGLLMENRPEYLAMWLGLAKVGGVTALLNTHLRGDALAHCVEAAGCDLLLLGEECSETWLSLGKEVPGITVMTVHDPRPAEHASVPGSGSLDAQLADNSTDNPPLQVRSALRGADPLFYIYTSGTTGLPKAARLSHARFMGGGIYATLAGMGKKDVMYCPLPLYHTSGGVMCVNAVLRKGATLALARQFSAHHFWEDVAHHGATAFQYIGELCRYLVNQPAGPLDKSHRLRLAIGNGLRPDVWKVFQQRFAVAHIVEFYGATESNVAMVNLAGREGSVGKPFPGLQTALVRFDTVCQDVVRGADGYCQACAPGESGELLGRISEGRSAAGRFEGYTSRAATEQKILRDVFASGDAWFRTGDLLFHDTDGFYYFVDRVGDTFRWKGENVSTQEVAEAVMAQHGVHLCAVYGVELPAAEGRAGMAAVVLEPGTSLDGEVLFKGLENALPAYARPAFVRIQQAAELTGTFKLRKVDLQKQGYETGASQDRILYRDDEGRTYRLLDPQSYSRIQNGELHF